MMKKLILLVSMRNIVINVFLFFILINNHSVKANPDIFFKNKIEPYCNAELSFAGYNGLNSQKINRITLNDFNLREWLRNHSELSLNKENNRYVKVKDKNKKFFDNNLIVEFDNGDICNFKSRFRQHGGRFDHVGENFDSSLRISIKDGNIAGIRDFTIFKPETRNKDQEIFITQLLKELNFIVPETYYVDVNFLGIKNRYIFQERFSNDFLEKNGFFNSFVVSTNKTDQFKDIFKKKFFLARLDGKSIIDEKDLIDSVFYNYNELIIDTYSKHNNIADEHYYFNLGSQKSNQIIHEKTHVFDALLYAANASDALEADDRKFFYNNLSGFLEPIYYDGMPRLSANQIFDLNKIPNYSYIKKGAEKGKKLILNLDKNDFYLNLKRSGLISNEIIFEEYLNSILKNLNKLINRKDDNILISYQQNPLNIENKKFSYLYFENQSFFECEKKNKCKQKEFSFKQINRILKNHVTKISNKNYVYYPNIRLRKNNDKKYLLKVDQKFEIFSYGKFTYKLKENSKILEISLNGNSDTIYFTGDIDEWKISFINNNINTKKLENCVVFKKVNFKNTTIHSRNLICKVGINIISSQGKLAEIKSLNSGSETIEVTNSNLEFNEINITNSLDDCLNLRKGIYYIENLLLSNCKDKGINVSYNSKADIENLLLKNSTTAIYAKDSSDIYIKNAILKNIEYCIASYRTKRNYAGSKVKYKNINYCPESKKIKGEGSVINN